FFGRPETIHCKSLSSYHLTPYAVKMFSCWLTKNSNRGDVAGQSADDGLMEHNSKKRFWMFFRYGLWMRFKLAFRLSFISLTQLFLFVFHRPQLSITPNALAALVG